MSMAISHIGFHYDEREDRVRLVCDDVNRRTQVLWLTRRMTLRMVRGFATLLSRYTQDIWPAMGATRTDAIVNEHLAALSYPSGFRPLPPRPASATSATTAAGRTVLESLVSHVDVRPEGDRFGLIFHSGQGELLHIRPTREEFHRLLAALLNLSVRAQWDVPIQDSWLAAAEQARQTSSKGMSLH